MRTDTVVWFQEVLPAPAEAQLLGLPADQRFAAEVDGPTDPSTYPDIYGVYPLELAIPGDRLIPCAGLTWVGVHPDHRRRGVLGTMLRHHFERVHEEPGTHVSALHASESLPDLRTSGAGTTCAIVRSAPSSSCRCKRRRALPLKAAIMFCRTT